MNAKLTNVIKEIITEFIDMNELEMPLYPHETKTLYDRFCKIMGKDDIYNLECSLRLLKRSNK